MAQPLPRHPAAVVRTHEVRALIVLAAVLLALAVAAVAGLVDDDDAVRVTPSSPVPERVTDSVSVQTEQPRASVGGKSQPVGTRFDGGPDEGTRGAGR
jgi:hypothetical protein